MGVYLGDINWTQSFALAEVGDSVFAKNRWLAIFTKRFPKQEKDMFSSPWILYHQVGEHLKIYLMQILFVGVVDNHPFLFDHPMELFGCL